MERTIGSDFPSRPQGSYVRDAYLNGLDLEEQQGFNPFRFGLIGSSDTHNAAGSFREEDYWSKTGLLDITPEQRGSVPRADTGEYDDPTRQYWGASGLAAVWAESNTREDIFRALKREGDFRYHRPPHARSLFRRLRPRRDCSGWRRRDHKGLRRRRPHGRRSDGGWGTTSAALSGVGHQGPDHRSSCPSASHQRNGPKTARRTRVFMMCPAPAIRLQTIPTAAPTTGPP